MNIARSERRPARTTAARSDRHCTLKTATSAISIGHYDTRMVAYYDRNRQNISRNSTHAVSAWIEGAD